ncbi:hypothetical protein A2954_01535 [Candidatus Roizmanbacteria bacterium RIFCSPLOWO2_01_FULL_37_12]|uniref:Aspartyl/glutamyl-tRNA(Asn/Gln) amidotransferase subunit C n=1 Tax=Candidatus Roizmanbacteria bacterium RIFCSPLOWO2_01_FULL_37_12 TaxID=1802056 RepID=A0A1F7I8X9_9BACT|nr:MAG: hypothetical protein A3D76_03085 [Candidatus Roizmanbacteria bacterium RIFCSPHIGHO2_02_FULL_37_9b]OGK39826.1 MAG: hypothetical protein A2954_01535 [Candidatus Roizmanbacteria bacterium RIFCSPLOWO2_01_FULL_37_12]
MTKKKVLSEDSVKHLAKLANLSLSENELKKYSEQLDETIDYVENLKKLNTGQVSPTSHSVHQVNVFFVDGEKNLRILSAKDVLKNSIIKNKFFVVKRII